MNTVVTSKQEILNTCLKMIQEVGWDKINIRSVAAACGVSVGSIYNYFSNKSELNTAIVESVWKEIFGFPQSMANLKTIGQCIEWIYACMQKGETKYPNFYSIHAVSFSGLDKKEGQELMFRTWSHIKQSLVYLIQGDKGIKEDAFDDVFTCEAFVEIIFSYMIASIVQQNYDCKSLLAMVNKLLY